MKQKNIFPKITGKSGGYSVRFGFMDEGRGERYFDSEFGISNYSEQGKFSINSPLNYRGEFLHTLSPTHTIGKSLRVGDLVNISIRKWSSNRVSQLPGATIKIVNVVLDEEHKRVLIDYEVVAK